MNFNVKGVALPFPEMGQKTNEYFKISSNLEHLFFL